MTGYDVIGDIHGCGDALERLLAELGYRVRDGAHRRPGRQAVFVGDLVDRGPDQPRVLEIVRSMVDAGTARCTLGNHEFNAIAWATPDGDGGWYRAHSTKNRGQHAAFLDQVGEESATHRSWIAWFRTLPLWLDLGGLRVVHACWDEPSMRQFGGPDLTDAMVAAPKGSELYEAIETVLKGPEVDLGGRVYLDKERNPRHRARIRWWDPDADTLATAAHIPGDATDLDGNPFEGSPTTRSRAAPPSPRPPAAPSSTATTGAPAARPSTAPAPPASTGASSTAGPSSPTAGTANPT